MKTVRDMTEEELRERFRTSVRHEMTVKPKKARQSWRREKLAILAEMEKRGIDTFGLEDDIKASIGGERHPSDGLERSGVEKQAQRKPRIMYIELKSGYSDNGPARIGRVTFSKSYRTIYYKGKTFQRIKGGGVSGNYYDIETGEEYWISGVKKNAQDRHWAGVGSIEIDDDVREEYSKIVGKT